MNMRKFHARRRACSRARRCLPALAQGELVDGQVTKIDASAGKITIRHGPMKKFDMDDGMTMVFRAEDPAMLKAVKAGDKVKFDARAHQRPVHRHQDREGEIAGGGSPPRRQVLTSSDRLSARSRPGPGSRRSGGLLAIERARCRVMNIASRTR